MFLQEKMRGQRGRLPDQPLGYVMSTKVIFRPVEVCFSRSLSSETSGCMSAEIGERSDFSTTKPSGCKSITAPTRQRPPHPCTIRDSTSSKKPNETDGMTVVRQYYETRGVSKSAVGSLMASWGGGTKKQYSGYIKKWTALCLKRKVNHLQPPVVAVLDFLSELIDKGLTYSAINCARSALSSYVSLDDGSVVGQNPLVCRLLKCVFQSRPPKPKHTDVWDFCLCFSFSSLILQMFSTLQCGRTFGSCSSG